MNTADKITINGVVYVREGLAADMADPIEDCPYVIVRTHSAGVFAGYLVKREGQVVTLRMARRLWYWSGAASLSQLAVDGVKNINACKFPIAVASIELLQTIEILQVTKKAQDIIALVPIWEA